MDTQPFLVLTPAPAWARNDKKAPSAFQNKKLRL
jgi:hypothetical protein